MGDSSCLIHGFSYASAIPNESKQGNPMHVLGESISFGKYMNESLSWEKWSSFSHNKYVEEAERYAQPGSVAQKKAFFEAHYKKIAAQKAAALLEQENEKTEGEGEIICDDEKRVELDSGLEVNGKLGELNGNDHGLIEVEETCEENENGEGDFVKRNSIDNFENQERVSVSEESGTPKQMERPLLKKNYVASEDVPSVTSKKRSGLSSLKSSIQRKTWRVPATPSKPASPHFKKEKNFTESTKKYRVQSTEKKRSTPSSLRSLINFNSIKEPDKEPIPATKKIESAGIHRSIFRPPKDCPTPLRTPIVAAASKGAAKYSASTPRSEKKSCPKSFTAPRNKLETPSASTPFVLRTEERAAKRKQKLEEKFNADEVQKVQQLQRTTLKEKAGNEFRKLGQSFCFKARPLPNFYKEREVLKTQMKKTPIAQPQTTVLGRSTAKKKQGTVSMPTPPPPPKSLNNDRLSYNISKKKVPYPVKSQTIERRIRHENISPNIQ